MNKERLEVLEKVIGYWDIDIENGIITTPRGSHGGKNGKGRLMTSVMHNGKNYGFCVHEIIAFAGGLNILHREVNHIDGDKMNNKFSNLECITRKENVEHQLENNLTAHGSKHGNTRLTELDVIEIRRLHSEGVSQKKLSEMFNTHSSGINRIVKRVNWKHI